MLLLPYDVNYNIYNLNFDGIPVGSEVADDAGLVCVVHEGGVEGGQAAGVVGGPGGPHRGVGRGQARGVGQGQGGFGRRVL